MEIRVATLATCKCACLLACFHMAACVGVKALQPKMVIFAIFCQVPCDKVKTAPRWIPRRLTGAAGKWRLKRKDTLCVRSEL